jgi:hypothetical protein
VTDIVSGHGGPVALALALLDKQWPTSPPLTDVIGADACMEGDIVAVESNPRYLMGRLQQALTVLLAMDLPPMDALTSLLSQALADAIAWRQHMDRSCDNCGQSLCAPCNADWDQADRYHALTRALGAVGDPPRRST